MRWLTGNVYTLFSHSTSQNHLHQRTNTRLFTGRMHPTNSVKALEMIIINYKRNITTTIKIKCDVHHCQQLWNKSICTRVQREAKPKPSLIKQHHTDSVSCWNSNRPATTCARASQLTVCVNLYLILNTTNCKIFCGACLKGQSNPHAVNTTVTDL